MSKTALARSVEATALILTLYSHTSDMAATKGFIGYQ